jgi:spore germination protein KB
MHRQYPGVPLTGYLQIVLGRPIGWLVSFVYINYFFYLASRNIRDYAELLSESVLDRTPLIIISSLMVFTVCYVLWLGVKVMARMAEIFIVIFLFMLILMLILVVFSGIIHVDYLFPVLEQGWKPVFKAIPSAYNFPFAEMIVFLMYFPYMKKSEKALEIGQLAILVTGIVLCVIVIMDIVVLGTHTATRSSFPLFEVVRRINIAEFIQRLDPLIILTLIIGVFFKVAIYFYAGIIGVADLFKVRDHRLLVIPAGIVILYSSLLVAKGIADHLKEGLKVLPEQVHPIMRIVIPVLLLLIGYVRHRISTRKLSA